MAIPRLALPSSGAPVGLPRPLPADVARLVSAVFRNPGMPLTDFPVSDLLGHVLADRYLSGALRPSLGELRSWLARFGDLPDAPQLRAIMQARRPSAARFAEHVTASFIPASSGDDFEAGDRLLPRNPLLDRTVREAARAGQFDRATRLVTRTSGLTPIYGALLRAEIARAMFSQGHDLQALALSETANRQAHGGLGLAPWVGGLSAWRLGRFDLARSWFEAAWRAPLIAPGQRAGAAYWAARASLVTRGDHGPWMRRASQDARTFYGMLARHVLGEPIHATATRDQDTLAEADVDAIAATARGFRAFALLQVGQPARAAAELRLLFGEMREQAGFGRSVSLVARAAGLQELAGQLAAILEPAEAHLPAAGLRPAGGFRLDPALVYALARLESNFDTSAVSPAGARGLMQLMPGTASFVLAGTPGKPRLHDPATNLDLGQRYLLQLTQLEVVGPDLIRLLASYNAGPGNFSHWMEVMAREHDPLLFIEALPGEETRAYVPRALAYTWLYAARLGLPSPSLDALAAGSWPQVETRPSRRDMMARLH